MGREGGREGERGGADRKTDGDGEREREREREGRGVQGQKEGVKGRQTNTHKQVERKASKQITFVNNHLQ